MIKEYDTVALTIDILEKNLRRGDLGTVVMIHGDHLGYELEIFSADGSTLDVVTVKSAQVRPVTKRDILHAREQSA